MKAILHTSNRQIPVELAEDTSGLIFVTNQKTGQVLFHLEPTTTRISQSSEGPPASGVPALAGRLNPHAPNWDWLMPETVIEYFRNSPVLNYMTDEVAARLKDEAAAGEAISHIRDDLAAVEPYIDNIIDFKTGHFVYGYQSRIAEALQIPNAGNFRRRIKNVATRLARRYSTSTTAESPDESEKKRQMA